MTHGDQKFDLSNPLVSLIRGGLVLSVVFLLIFWGLDWIDRSMGWGVAWPLRLEACVVVWFSMLLGMVASTFPRGNEAAGLRLGLATFCRTGLPLLHLLLIMFNYPAEIVQPVMGYIAIGYLIGFPLSIGLSLGNETSSN